MQKNKAKQQHRAQLYELYRIRKVTKNASRTETSTSTSTCTPNNGGKKNRLMKTSPTSWWPSCTAWSGAAAPTWPPPGRVPSRRWPSGATWPGSRTRSVHDGRGGCGAPPPRYLAWGRSRGRCGRGRPPWRGRCRRTGGFGPARQDKWGK